MCCCGLPCRQIRCLCCGKIFRLCIGCYRGHRYCSVNCQLKARKAARAEIQRKYRSSERGQEKTKEWAAGARKRCGNRKKLKEIETAEVDIGDYQPDEYHTSPLVPYEAIAHLSPLATVAEIVGDGKDRQNEASLVKGNSSTENRGKIEMSGNERWLCHLCGKPLSGEIVQGRWTRRRKHNVQRRACLRAPPIKE